MEIKGSKIKSSKDSEDSFNRSRVGLEHVKGIIERVEVLLLSVLVHLDGPGLTDFLPLSQRKQQQQNSVGSHIKGGKDENAFIRRTPHKPCCRGCARHGERDTTKC